MTKNSVASTLFNISALLCEINRAAVYAQDVADRHDYRRPLACFIRDFARDFATDVADAIEGAVNDPAGPWPEDLDRKLEALRALMRQAKTANWRPCAP